jgi:chromosome segregation ATPase
MDANETELLARVQTAFDLGNPDQMKLYDDILAEKDQTTRLIKLSSFVLDISRPSAHPSRSSWTQKLLSQIQYLISVLQALTSNPTILGDVLSQEALNQIPRTFFEEQAKRLREAGPSLRLEEPQMRSFQEICGKLGNFKRQRIQIESTLDVNELKEHCVDLAGLFEFACLLNDLLIRRGVDKVGSLVNAELKNQAAQIAALKRENQMLLERLQEIGSERLGVAREEFDSLMEEKEALGRGMKRMKAENKQLSLANAKLVVDLEEVRAASQQENESHVSRMRELQEELSESKLQLNRYGELKIRAKELRRENAALRQSLIAAERKTIQPPGVREEASLVKDLRTENASLVEANTALKDRVKNLEEIEMEELRKANENLTRLLSEKTAEASQIDEALRASTNENDRLLAEMSSLTTTTEAKLRLIESESKSHRELIRTLSSEKKKWKAKVESLNQELAVSRARLDKERQDLQRSLCEIDVLSKAARDASTESEQLRQSFTELEREHQMVVQELQRALEDEHLLRENANATINDMQAFLRDRSGIETSLHRANETIDSLEQRCAEVTRVSQERETMCLALKEQITVLESTGPLAELRGQYLALQKAYQNAQRKHLALANNDQYDRETLESIFEIGYALANAIGDVFVGAQPMQEIRQLIERVRIEHGKTIVLEKIRREVQSHAISLPRMNR